MSNVGSWKAGNGVRVAEIMQRERAEFAALVPGIAAYFDDEIAAAPDSERGRAVLGNDWLGGLPDYDGGY